MSTIVDEAALDEVLHSAFGPIQRAMFAEAEDIRLHAASKIPRGERGPYTHQGPHMADQSLVEDTAVAGLPAFLIAFESDHAAFYNFGTRPHEIRARNAPMLVFKWPKVGPGLFRFKKINHPGTDAHPFLNETVLEMYGVHLA